MLIADAASVAGAAAGSEMAVWISSLSFIVNAGFSIGVAWWLLTKSMPQMQETFTKALKDEREIAEQAELRRTEDSKQKLSILIADSKERLELVLQHCERESTRRDEAFKTHAETTNRTLVNVGEVLENVRLELLDCKEERRTHQRRRGGQ